MAAVPAYAINPTLQLHLLVLIFAATTILGRLSSLSAPVLVTWRCLLATAGAMLWVKVMSDRKLWLSKSMVGKLMGVGVLIGLHWLCLFGAVKIANISIALAGLATISLFTAFAEPLLNRQRIQRYEVMLGLLVLGGIVLIAGTQSNYFLGLGLALISALLAALFMVINKHMVVTGSDPMVMVFWEMMAATAVCCLAIPIFDPSGFEAMLFTDPMDWLWLSILAFGCTVYAQDLTNRLLRQISAYKFNLAANFEPVYGIAAAALIFGEHEELQLTFYLGALTILLANFLQPPLQRRFHV
ncbi:MAG: drug/metabolite transporter (DMT)-like permease [Crocinitomicaceae bacterium]|jgi:drug/metabolite transporter (DMT)-like permease